MNEPRKIALTFLVVMAIGLFALAVEWMREKLNGWLLLIVVSIMLLIMALMIHPVRARDDGRYAQSPLKPWFDGLKSGKGPCCSDADGWALSDVDWESKGGRYRVRVPRDRFVPSGDQREPPKGVVMIWVDVDDDAVITVPNRARVTMVWPLWGSNGLTIRCFMPGVMG